MTVAERVVCSNDARMASGPTSTVYELTGKPPCGASHCSNAPREIAEARTLRGGFGARAAPVGGGGGGGPPGGLVGGLAGGGTCVAEPLQALSTAHNTSNPTRTAIPRAERSHG